MSISPDYVSNVKDAIVKALHQEGYDGQNHKFNAGPVLVRLAW